MPNLPTEWTTVDQRLKLQIGIGDQFKIRTIPGQNTGIHGWSDAAKSLINHDIVAVCVSLENHIPFAVAESNTIPSSWGANFPVNRFDGLYITTVDNLQLKVFSTPPEDIFEDIIL